MNEGKWLAVTAGLGSAAFEEAALRVKADLEKSAIVDRVIAVTTDYIFEVCPRTTSLYSEITKSDVRGFGFMSWKAEIVHAAFEGKWGQYDGVIWIDAGCEVSINPISRISFRRFQRYAMRNGIASFTLKSAEIAYTKRDLFEVFPEIDPEKSGNQIQSTWMFFSGQTGRNVAKKWFDTVCIGTYLLDLQPSKKPENALFVENRYDQSTFSLVCKSLGIKPMRYRPTTGTGSFSALLKGLTQPIWTSRNRSGNTRKIKMHTLLESL